MKTEVKVVIQFFIMNCHYKASFDTVIARVNNKTREFCFVFFTEVTVTSHCHNLT